MRSTKTKTKQGTMLLFAALLLAVAALGCGGEPQTVEVEVTRIVPQTLEVTRVVPQTVEVTRFVLATQIVPQTVEVTRIMRVVVTASPRPDTPKPKATSTPPPAKPSPLPPSPTPVVATWHKVKSWSGSGMKTTEQFEIPGREWRVNWTNKEGQQIFQIYLYKDGELYLAQSVLANTLDAGSDTTYVYASGTFHLQINATGPWSVEVEAKY